MESQVAMLRCPRCPMSLGALEWAEHASRVHVGGLMTKWRCAECVYESLALTDAIAHCLIDRHDPEGICALPPQHLLALAKQTLLRNPREGGSGKVERASSPPRPPSVLNTSIPPPLPKVARKTITPGRPYSPAEKPVSRTRKRRAEERTESPAREQSDHEVRPLPHPHSRDEGWLEGTDCDEDEGERRLEIVSTESPPKLDLVGGRSQCQTCGSKVRLQTKTGTRSLNNAVQHVISCLKVKPYSCGACGLTSGRRIQVVNHTAKSADCRDAPVNLLQKSLTRHLCRPLSGR